LVAVGAMIAAAFAYGSNLERFSGSVKGGGRVAFGALQNPLHPRKYPVAGLFHLKRIPLKCDEGTAKGTFETRDAAFVKDREFSYKFHLNRGETAKLTGKFNRRGDKARGEFDVSNVDLANFNNCTSRGPRSWRASR
jgi:hypothetical protein